MIDLRVGWNVLFDYGWVIKYFIVKVMMSGKDN